MQRGDASDRIPLRDGTTAVGSRRGFVAGLVALGCGGAVGAGVGAVARGSTPPARLRPPGAGRQSDFLAACIRCGQCSAACPQDALSVVGGWNVLLGADLAGYATPEVDDPRARPCTLCPDLDAMPCVAACPTDALSDPGARDAVHMGTAELETATCYAYNGVTCRACWHACPYPGAALTFDERLRPVVSAEHCVGCGLCVRACLTEEASIHIAPRGELAVRGGAA